MKDLINNLAAHLELNVIYDEHDNDMYRVYRVIDEYPYYYSFRCDYKSIGDYLQIAHEHFDAVEESHV
jgi:hypothetical protein